MPRTPKSLALTIVGAAAIALVVSVSGCSALLPPTHTKPKQSAVADAPSDSPSATPSPTSAPSAPPVASGDATAPGAHLTIGQPATLPFSNSDDGQAMISATVNRIDPAPQAEVDALVASNPQLAGNSVYYVWVDLKKVSGAPVAYNAMYTDFKAIDANGDETQALTIFGGDLTCTQDSFSDTFDTSGETLSVCVAAIAPAGGNPPAGAEYSAYDTPYDSYDGQPVKWY